MIAALLFALAERVVTPGAAGPNRLDPDAAVLSTASPLRYAVGSENGRRSYTLTAGLEDLRLHDAGGTEHPYLLIAPSSRQPQWQRTTLRTIAASKTSSGFEADLGSVRNVDRVRIDGIATPFLKRLRLEGSGDRVHWSVLSPDARGTPG